MTCAAIIGETFFGEAAASVRASTNTATESVDCTVSPGSATD